MLLCLATTRAQHDTLPYYVGIPQFFMEQSIYDETYDIFAEHRWAFGEMFGRTLSGIFFTQGLYMVRVATAHGTATKQPLVQ